MASTVALGSAVVKSGGRCQRVRAADPPRSSVPGWPGSGAGLVEGEPLLVARSHDLVEFVRGDRDARSVAPASRSSTQTQPPGSSVKPELSGAWRRCLLRNLLTWIRRLCSMMEPAFGDRLTPAPGKECLGVALPGLDTAPARRGRC